MSIASARTKCFECLASTGVKSPWNAMLSHTRRGSLRSNRGAWICRSRCGFRGNTARRPFRLRGP
jgi:hypothetical protein